MPQAARVLIVEDEWLLVRKISRYLERKSFLVAAVTSAVGATQVVLGQKPEIVLMDMRLPDVNGIEYCHCLLTYAAYCRDARAKFSSGSRAVA